jgi:YggT family protein
VKDLLLALIDILRYALLGQVILSWLVVAGVRNDFVLRLYSALGTITEPLIRPIRRVVPQVGAFDISVLVAFLVLWLLRSVINSRL